MASVHSPTSTPRASSSQEMPASEAPASETPASPRASTRQESPASQGASGRRAPLPSAGLFFSDAGAGPSIVKSAVLKARQEVNWNPMGRFDDWMHQPKTWEDRRNKADFASKWFHEGVLQVQRVASPAYYASNKILGNGRVHPSWVKSTTNGPLADGTVRRDVRTPDRKWVAAEGPAPEGVRTRDCTNYAGGLVPRLAGAVTWIGAAIGASAGGVADLITKEDDRGWYTEQGAKLGAYVTCALTQLSIGVNAILVKPWAAMQVVLVALAVTTVLLTASMIMDRVETVRKGTEAAEAEKKAREQAQAVPVEPQAPAVPVEPQTRTATPESSEPAGEKASAAHPPVAESPDAAIERPVATWKSTAASFLRRLLPSSATPAPAATAPAPADAATEPAATEPAVTEPVARPGAVDVEEPADVFHDAVETHPEKSAPSPSLRRTFSAPSALVAMPVVPPA